MTENMKVWNAVKQPPPSALRTIQAGRLRGMTVINPQWRYQAMTEQFGMCGVGWKYEVLRVWNEPLPDGQVLAFAEIRLKVKHGDEWVDIPGIGGSILVSKETAGLHASDEGYKMAITDALSVAMKMLGVGADIYAGLWDGSKYEDQTPQQKPPEKQAPTKPPLKKELDKPIPEDIAWFRSRIRDHAKNLGWGKAKAQDFLKTNLNKLSVDDLTKDELANIETTLLAMVELKNNDKKGE